ncbi:MAG: hypothetical protein KA010_04595, partial [Saprospiraceae bacterium]|nr:hypothetical protein [Saprospiraceae bacterium]
DVFDLIAKIGIGDIDISDDFSKLYVVSLFDKKVYTIDIATKTLVGSGIAVPNPCTGGESRPFGLKYHRGTIYVGAVCDAQSSQNVANLDANLYRLDGSTFTNILNIPLDYVKGKAMDDDPTTDYWRPWKTTFLPTPDFAAHPSPIFADIEFDTNEDLILIFDDRYGSQMGTMNLGTDPNDGNTFIGVASGDILRASYNGSSYTLESNGTAGSNTTAGAGNNQGPGGGEFYFEDSYSDYHHETVMGGSALKAGSGEVSVAAYDPFDVFSTGIYWMSNTLGTTVDKYLVNEIGEVTGSFGKTNGLGDIELLCNPAPIEIGNRVWLDSNGDGVQDPGEAPIQGVTVQLLKSGSVIATATTDAQGRYVFSNDPTKASGASTDPFRYNITQLTANMAYTVHFPTTATVSGTSYSLTSQNSTTGAGVDDWIDSDATSTGDITILTTDIPTTGANNHTFDVGYRLATVSCSLTSVTATPTTCDVSTNEYEISGNISFTSAPTSGTLTVSISGGGSQVLSAPFTSPTAYNITGLDSDGVSHTVTAVFSADATCTNTTTYTAPDLCFAPVDVCNTTSITAQAGTCDVATNRYTLTGQITFVSAPTSGTIIVSESGGGSVTLSAPFTNPLNYTINNLYADGLNHVVNMSLSTVGNCTNNAAYTAPNGCSSCFSTPCGRTTVIKN